MGVWVCPILFRITLWDVAIIILSCERAHFCGNRCNFCTSKAACKYSVAQSNSTVLCHPDHCWWSFALTNHFCRVGYLECSGLWLIAAPCSLSMYLADFLHGDVRMTAWLNGRGVKCNVRTEPFSLPEQGKELHQQTVSSMKAQRAVIGVLCD